jgi:putative two-component system response regulator
MRLTEIFEFPAMLRPLSQAKYGEAAGMENGNILAVDDTPASLKLLTDLLKAEGYKVRSSVSGEMALSAAAACPPELVLLDINMPGLNGYDVCERLKAQPETREVPVIFVSALSETVEKVKGFNLGAVDFVTKPYHREELLARVRTHMELYRLRHRLEQAVETRTAELQESEQKIRGSLIDTVAVLAAAAELRDPYTAGHMRRVAEIASAIARELRLPAEQAEGLYLSSLVHDIGKIKIPLEILGKPGQLLAVEFSLIKDHARAGYEILHTIDFPWPVADIVLQHHERMDGTGYPQGLKEDAILKEARILAVADAVEAIMSDRPYRAGLGVDVALKEISSKRGRFYWEPAADACVSLFRDQGWRPEIKADPPPVLFQ